MMEEKMLEEKECEICGAFFTQTRSTQKYCPECRKNSYNANRKMNGHIKASIRKYGMGHPVREYHNTCLNCGKEFVSYKYEKEYCCGSCREQHHIKNTFCEFCGKPMTETQDQYDTNGHAWLCSDECREALAWKIARENGTVKTCPQCGKEYIKNTKYCSRECYLAYSRTHEREKKPDQTVMEQCIVCGKDFECSVKRLAIPLCSDKCAEKYHLRCEQRRKEIEEAKKRKNEEQVKKKKKEEGLCLSCKTSYKDCERMSSGFTASPKGSVFKGSIVIKCPKYKG